MKKIWQEIIDKLRDLLNFGEDRMQEQVVIDSISSDVNFRGAKLWLLVIAVFVASLGLNINSTAVIIGAMLISPLMGPIIGMGLGVGINDYALFKRSLWNYLIATLFSVLTAMVYFQISPITEAQSELLARTTPSIYDVCIALCGGLAGIIALSNKSQRMGNVIPGVAIATALMPPLCTVGYGIATGSLTFVLGAFFLYLINSVFIALSTSVCVAFVLNFPKKVQVNKERGKKVTRIFGGIVIATIVPSIILTFSIVQSTIAEQRAKRFVEHELAIEDAHVVRHKYDHREKSLQVMLLGNSLDSANIRRIEKRLSDYKLDDVSLQIIQGSNSIEESEFIALLDSYQKNVYKYIDEHSLTSQDRKSPAASLSEQCIDIADTTLLSELQYFFPFVSDVVLSQGVSLSDFSRNVKEPSPRVIVEIDQTSSDEEKSKMEEWLTIRTGLSSDNIITYYSR